MHNAKCEFVESVQLRVPKDSSSVGDVLAALKQRLGPEWQELPLRLVEIFNHKIFKVGRAAVRYLTGVSAGQA